MKSNTYFLSFIFLFVCLIEIQTINAQTSAIAKSVVKSGVKIGAKSTAKATAKQIAEETGKDITQQYSKRLIRKEVLRQAETKGYKNFASYWIERAFKSVEKFSLQKSTHFKPYFKRNEIYKNNIKLARKNPSKKLIDPKKIVKRIIPDHLPNSKGINKAIEDLCAKSSFFNKEHFIVEMGDNGYFVKYTGDIAANANTAIFVRNDGVIVASSSKVGSSLGKNGNNEFLLNLIPNQKYYIDDAIELQTDAAGRIIKSNANITDLSKIVKDNRNNELQKQFAKRGGKNYEGGHLHAHSTGGPDEIEVAMHHNINHHKLWRGLEDKEARCAKEGKKVTSTVKLIYDDAQGDVPAKIIKTTTIDGKTTQLICDNINGTVIEKAI